MENFIGASISWIILLVFLIICFVRRNSRIQKLDENQKEILKSAREKTKIIKIILTVITIVMLVIVIMMYSGVFAVLLPEDSNLNRLDPVNTLPPITVSYRSILKINELAVTVGAVLLFTYYIYLIYVNKTKKLDEEERKILIQVNGGRVITATVLLIFLKLWNIFLDFVFTPVEKPIIYLYPKDKTEVNVKLGKKEKLTCTYPKYNEGWNVTAYPDGTLEDKNGKKYYALYWECLGKVEVDKTKGFCVKGEDTIKFLEEKLELLGLNYKERQEFIVYWLPKLENNKYNYIYFKQTEEVNEIMDMEINPKPDSLIRIVMVFKPLNKEIKVEEQKIITPQRHGFTVVEWGGSKI